MHKVCHVPPGHSWYFSCRQLSPLVGMSLSLWHMASVVPKVLTFPCVWTNCQESVYDMELLGIEAMMSWSQIWILSRMGNTVHNFIILSSSLSNCCFSYIWHNLNTLFSIVGQWSLVANVCLYGGKFRLQFYWKFEFIDISMYEWTLIFC